MEQCLEIKARHASRPASDFNDDTIYRSLVTEMLAIKSHAIIKMESLMWMNPADEPFTLEKPLRVAFRDNLGVLVQSIKQNKSPNVKDAVHLCKMYGLITENVNETNELGETPLMATCADIVTSDKMELLIKAGSNVNFTMSYPGLLRKGMNPLLTCSVYGYNELIQALVDNGADPKIPTLKGESAANLAAGFGHADTIDLLYRLGVNLNKTDDEGRTPMFKAASFGHTDTVGKLLKLGMCELNQQSLCSRDIQK